MALNNGTILTAPTLSATGGTSSTLTSDGLSIANGIHLIDASVTDFRIRPSITCKVKSPTYDVTTKSYSKGKKSFTLTIPKLLANGETKFTLIRIELEDHPEMVDAEYNKLMQWGSQALFDADFTAFWKTGSVA